MNRPADLTAASPAPRILCVAGSPRRRGNSEQLLDALMRGRGVCRRSADQTRGV